MAGAVGDDDFSFYVAATLAASDVILFAYFFAHYVHTGLAQFD